MKSTKLTTRALGGIVAVVITGLIFSGIDALALGYSTSATWSNPMMARSGQTTGKGAS